MKLDLSEEAIRAQCPHCDTSSMAFAYPLDETEGFHLVCDAHPLVEGHIMLISQEHLPCVGAYPADLLADFETAYQRCLDFVTHNYGEAASFEHGHFGQTVFHSHIHVLPFDGAIRDVVPEGADHCLELRRLNELADLYERDGGYLFASFGDRMWTVDPNLAAPRFFRDRFAAALGRPERSNWKATHDDERMMHVARQENQGVQERWRDWGCLAAP